MAKYSKSEVYKNQRSFSLRRIVTNPKLFFLVALIILVALLIPTLKNYAQRKSIEREIEDMKQEISEFDQKNKELEEMMAYLSSTEALEDKARTSFGLKKVGENVLVVKDESNTISSSSSSEVEAEKPSRFNQWYNYFFK